MKFLEIAVVVLSCIVCSVAGEGQHLNMRDFTPVERGAVLRRAKSRKGSPDSKSKRAKSRKSTDSPTSSPTYVPTTYPPTTSNMPSTTTKMPTETPTESPTEFPTYSPTMKRSKKGARSSKSKKKSKGKSKGKSKKTSSPTESPTEYPTENPTEFPTVSPTISNMPSLSSSPSTSPPTTESPTESPIPPSEPPTTASPTASNMPSQAPSSTCNVTVIENGGFEDGVIEPFMVNSNGTFGVVSLFRGESPTEGENFFAMASNGCEESILELPVSVVGCGGDVALAFYIQFDTTEPIDGDFEDDFASYTVTDEGTATLLDFGAINVTALAANYGDTTTGWEEIIVDLGEVADGETIDILLEAVVSNAVSGDCMDDSWLYLDRVEVIYGPY